MGRSGVRALTSTELLISLWLRELKASKCHRIITGWRQALEGPRRAANENLLADTDRERALQLLTATCEHCCKLCPRAGVRAVRVAPVALREVI
jgi:hypothetical protein